MPETWLFFWGGTPLYTMVLMGTKRNASPALW